MTSHNATIEVTCDGKGCTESITVALDFVYPDYSGRGGRYDHSDEAVNRKVAAEDWTVDPDNEDRHLCPFCTEQRAAE